jgi:hypothetical protein
VVVSRSNLGAGLTVLAVDCGVPGWGVALEWDVGHLARL